MIIFCLLLLVNGVIGTLTSSENVLESNGTFHFRHKRALVTKTVCYKGLGCFNTGPPFFQPPFRLISLPPLPPGRLRVTYLLYTRLNRNSPFSFEYETLPSVTASHFDPRKWTRVVVHGFLDGSYTTSWPLELKDALLDYADENVIFVDHTPFGTLERVIYMQSVADCRVIGAEIANILLFLQESYGMDISRVHIIGHSLGASIAGYAGERLKNLSRITALEPPGPDFRFVTNEVKVDTTDATFVDVIHSNPAPLTVLGLGSPEDLGHSNFWPNGGLIKGCPLSFIRILFTGILPFEAPAYIVNCRHRRSVEIFLFSLTQKSCFFVGVECPSYANYLQGRCDCGDLGEKCSFMGVRASPPKDSRKRYYTKIALERPYCLHQYSVSVFLRTNADQLKSLKTTMGLSLFGHQAIQETLELNVDLKVEKQFNTFLITTFQHLGDIHSARFHLNENFNFTSAYVEKLNINYLFPAPREETEISLCSSSENHIKKENLLIKSHCHLDEELYIEQEQ